LEQVFVEFDELPKKIKIDLPTHTTQKKCEEGLMSYQLNETKLSTSKRQGLGFRVKSAIEP
jgi:hypothetical protein